MRKARFHQDFRPGGIRGLTVCALLCAVAGCTPLMSREGKPLLRRPCMASDSIVLDIFLLRCPFGDPELNGPAWQEIDEQPFPAELRRHLLTNGFRAGVLTGPLPNELTDRLELADDQALPGEMDKHALEDLAKKPAVLRGHFQLRAGSRKEFNLGGPRDNLQVLLVDQDGEVSGMPYDRAQLLFAVTARLLNDGRVRLELVPEISHGREFRQHWSSSSQGIMRMNPGRSSRVFDDMRLDAVLAPGHFLVLSAVPSRPGSLGGQFFTEPSGEQVIMLIRLSQTQHDGQFDREADLVIE